MEPVQPRSHVRWGHMQPPHQDLHPSTSLSQEKLFSCALGGVQRQMEWDTQQLRKLQRNRQEKKKVRRLQDQLSGEDNHKEPVNVRSNSSYTEATTLSLWSGMLEGKNKEVSSPRHVTRSNKAETRTMRHTALFGQQCAAACREERH